MITSLLDNDLYKYTMQQAVLERYYGVDVEYRFTNRGEQRFSPEFLETLRKAIKDMEKIELTAHEYCWLRDKIAFFKPQYLEYLRNYRFNADEVSLSLDKENNLELIIKGPWHSTILWEVPLLALISECYFKTDDSNWKGDGQVFRAEEKARKLEEAGCLFADFGTRRRRSRWTQACVLKGLSKGSTFVGTSNVLFAKKLGCKPIGTMAHEFCQAMAVLESLNRPNKHMMKKWYSVYNGHLGIALTDTYGLEAFLEDFNLKLAKLFDGVRHDSGCPFRFADQIITHYKGLGIDPKSKTIVFSDSLNVKKAIELNEYCKGRIKCSFGIGTHFTNDFKESKALNIVIKLYKANGKPVVKLSDDPGKAIGEPDAIRVMKWLFFGEDL